MPAAIDLCIRDEKFSRVMRRDQTPAQGDIHVQTSESDQTVESINFATPADLVIWQALLMDLIERQNADGKSSTLKLVQNGDKPPFLYVNEKRGVEVRITREQLQAKQPQITGSL